MTLLVVMVLLAIAALLIAVGRDDPPGPSAGQWINNHAYREAVREARLRRLQRW